MTDSRSRVLIAPLFIVFVVSLSAKGQDRIAPSQRGVATGVAEILFMDAAKESEARARQYEASGRMFEAVQEYERVIAESQNQSAGVRHSYQFYVVIASARLDAARTRMAYGPSLGNDLKILEQNRSWINAHLNKVPSLVIAAAKEANASAKLNAFKCNAYKLLAHGQFLRGSINQSAEDLGNARKAYETILTCDPSTAQQTQELISHISFVERNLRGGLLSPDSLAKIAAKVVGVAVPRVGGFLSSGLEWGYDYQRQKKAPAPPPLRP